MTKRKKQNDDYTPALTPVQYQQGVWFKRDDLFKIAGVYGGKARSCWHLSQGADSLITASSRHSPQLQIVAHIAHRLKIPCRCHTPQGPYTPEMVDAESLGATIIQHKAGYNNVIIARAVADHRTHGGTYIPFGMECKEAIVQTATQAEKIPQQLSLQEISRVVIVLGSGMSAAGLLYGMKEWPVKIPLVGIQVGADPRPRLAAWAPFHWDRDITIVKSRWDYHEACQVQLGMELDPHYEAKVVEHLKPGDLFWVVGKRTVY
jgi:1-aminocyclopropane-1-carboxylate deaminase/D-cysteine desulfhydrase-like pyridoxal-dependent ACC family enzyme